MPSLTAPAPSDRSRLLRGIVVLLVLWDHVIAGWTSNHGRSWLPLSTIRDWVSGPLVIIQDFGFLGVAMFFLLSGYIISEVAVRESRQVFAVRRLLRIYPALVVSVFLIVGLDALRPSLGLSHQGFGMRQSAWAMTLLNYLRAAEAPVNGVAWSLMVEVLFYGLIFLCLGLLKRRPLLAIGVEISVHRGSAHLCARLSDRRRGAELVSPRRLGCLPSSSGDRSGRVDLAFTPCESARVAAAIAVAAWLLFVLGMRRIHTGFLAPASSYGVSVALASAVFVFAVANEERIRLPRWIASLSVISYSAYLIHGPLTEMIMDRLAPSVPFTVHMLIAIAVLAIVATLMWRLVEVPSQTLARRLTLPRSKSRKSMTSQLRTDAPRGQSPLIEDTRIDDAARQTSSDENA